jgi:Ca-activated chloride channel family protein
VNLQFQHKEFYWLFAGAAVLLLLFILLLAWKRKVIKRMGDEKLIQLLVRNFSSTKFIVKFILVVAAFMLGVVAAINPRRAGEDEGSVRKGIDVVIALDVSKSMLATDIAPNRLERAKQFIGKLMEEMPDDRIALVLFAGKAYLQMPLTTDHGAAGLFVSSASPDAVPQQGTVISDALNMGANAFNAIERKYRAIVLITDGEDHDDEAVATAKELAAGGVMVNTVGIGSPEGAPIPDIVPGENKKDEAGNTIISKLNENVLKELAAATNGVYVRLQTSDEAVVAIKNQLSQIDKKAFTDSSQMNFKNYYWWFAAAMFVLLVIEVFISERRRIVKKLSAV